MKGPFKMRGWSPFTQVAPHGEKPTEQEENPCAEGEAACAKKGDNYYWDPKNCICNKYIERTRN